MAAAIRQSRSARGLLALALLTCAALSVPVQAAFAAEGGLDRAFSGDGRVLTDLDHGSSDRVGAGIFYRGRLILAGSSTTAAGTRLAVAAYRADGSLDPTFGTGGILLDDTDGGMDAQTIAGDTFGQILIAGNHADGEVEVARLNGDGSLDPTFGADGVVTLPLRFAVGAVRPGFNGQVVVAGTIGSGAGSEFGVLRLGRDGAPDSSFGGDGLVTIDLVPGAPEEAADLVVDPINRLVIAGGAGRSGGSRFALARLTREGAIEPKLGGDGAELIGFGGRQAFATAAAVDIQDRIVIGGMAGGRAAFAAVRDDGRLDPGFASGGRVTLDVRGGYAPTDVADDKHGRIYAALGAADPKRASEGDMVALRLHRDGRPDRNFSRDGRVSTGFGRWLVSAQSSVLNAVDSLALVGTATLPGTGRSDFAAAAYRVAY